VEKNEGKSLASGAHIIGKQAQIIATFSSVIVHTEEAMSSGKILRKCLGNNRVKITMRTPTGSVGTGGRKVESLHTDNARNGDT
jgi:hypothetical protein